MTQYDAQDVIVLDVAVIGGGSSGTYGAVNLYAMGQSVVLIEKEAVCKSEWSEATEREQQSAKRLLKELIGEAKLGSTEDVWGEWMCLET